MKNERERRTRPSASTLLSVIGDFMLSSGSTTHPRLAYAITLPPRRRTPQLIGHRVVTAAQASAAGGSGPAVRRPAVGLMTEAVDRRSARRALTGGLR